MRTLIQTTLSRLKIQVSPGDNVYRWLMKWPEGPEAGLVQALCLWNLYLAPFMASQSNNPEWEDEDCLPDYESLGGRLKDITSNYSLDYSGIARLEARAMQPFFCPTDEWAVRFDLARVEEMLVFVSRFQEASFNRVIWAQLRFLFNVLVEDPSFDVPESCIDLLSRSRQRLVFPSDWDLAIRSHAAPIPKSSNPALIMSELIKGQAFRGQLGSASPEAASLMVANIQKMEPYESIPLFVRAFYSSGPE